MNYLTSLIKLLIFLLNWINLQMNSLILLPVLGKDINFNLGLSLIKNLKHICIVNIKSNQIEIILSILIHHNKISIGIFKLSEDPINLLISL